MVRKYGDIISGGGIIFASIFIFIATFSFKRLTVSRIGPSFVPQIMAGGLGVIGLLILISGIRKLKLLAASQETVQSENDDIRVTAVVASLVVMFIYILLLEAIGFVIMSALYLFAQFFILMHKDERNYSRMAIAAVVLSVVVYIVFVYAFQLRLPSGLL